MRTLNTHHSCLVPCPSGPSRGDWSWLVSEDRRVPPGSSFSDANGGLKSARAGAGVLTQHHGIQLHPRLTPGQHPGPRTPDLCPTPREGPRVSQPQE